MTESVVAPMLHARPLFSAAVSATIVLLALAAVPASSTAATLEPSVLEGGWTCTGAKGDVSFESRWTLEPSGSYTDASRVQTREDIDRDSTPDDLVIESTERGEWSVNADGKLQFHVTALELRGLRVDGEDVPLDQARSMMETLTSGAVGRVMMVAVEAAGADTLKATVSGIETNCTR